MTSRELVAREMNARNSAGSALFVILPVVTESFNVELPSTVCVMVGAVGLHVNPSPVNPALQEHVNPPSVLAQVALASQPPLLVEHSLMS